MNASTFPKPVLPVFLLVAVALCFLYSGAGFAQEMDKPAQKDPAKKKLHITSDKMVARQDASMIEFTGNVKATRADSVILADSIKIYFHPSSSNNPLDEPSDVKKIVSTGNVRYTSNDRKAFADKAVYTTEDEVLVLTGKSSKLLMGSSWITGKKITFSRKDDRAVVESGGQGRVEAVFNPEDQTP